MIDFHSHLIPGVDDGAQTLAETRAGLAAFAAQGVRTVVTTPHLQASQLARPAEVEAFFALLDPAWEAMRALGAAEFPEMRLARGLEVMLDTPAPDLSDPRVRLAGTPFVLVEFPFMAVPPNATQAVFELKMRGWTPIIAHPERYANLAHPDATAGWKRAGAHLQVNAGSLVGKYGPDPRRLAWGLLRRGLADYLSSDYHARGSIHLARARAALEEMGAGEQARLLLEENGARMLAGEAPLPVPPLAERRTFWQKLFGRR
ncbi:MAG TPA: CpsB/CapC family capsule biosynthesis tyrosine phosphatase [Longimicrobium sp.]|nr:CpsB/CapC family capsule biosynthesis tyrosine phosphatase [Longimicrobium sp.]